MTSNLKTTLTKPNHTKYTKPNIPNQIYQTKPTKQNLPIQIYKTKLIQPKLPKQISLSLLWAWHSSAPACLKISSESASQSAHSVAPQSASCIEWS